ncbi:molybdenum cofactor guanylyltransferase MobA [Enterovirga rhinocerotis]|uniref:Molybdenum cofactor guanylyltransferase n=1 Tax=Enterovirga rhinocerotis TaxID=1339210 RepID=A0A4R7C8M9_9HYPH|nr:molybdenum cofactor guanylyltransferase MobA [Enterovirga rhinocerotis]TDR95004.1 molybdenum cofactor guanylyltransferase [Enterovirga rhinocerotis]
MADRPLGAILAGGLAQRMGGGDKTLLLLAGRTILSRVVERLAPQCAGLILNANGDPGRFERYGLPVVPDGRPDFAGPLAGLLASLDYAATLDDRPDDVLTVSADTPFLPSDLVARLVEARRREGADLACTRSGGRTHPVIGLWPLRTRDDLRIALRNGERGVGRFASRFRLAVAEWETNPVDPFFNANTPADLEEAAAVLAQSPP